jgi:hypothetical protein
MGPAWCRGASLLNATSGPLSGEDIDLGRRERLIAWSRLQHMGKSQAVASALEERPGGAPSSRETREVGGSLVGEWTVAMASQDGRRSEQLVEHDGTLLRAGIPSRSNYVVKLSMNLPIVVLVCCAWQHI